MKAYAKLHLGQLIGHTVEVRPIDCKKEGGVASSTPDGMVQVFFGNSNGSDDCTITQDEFNRRFEVTCVVCS